MDQDDVEPDIEKERYQTKKKRPIIRAFTLVEPYQSPWRRLLQSQCPEAYHLVLGIAPPHYKILASKFQRFYGSDHRVALLEPFDVMGLTIMWLKSKMLQRQLSMIFGVVQSSISRYLYMGLRALSAMLRELPGCNSCWPSPKEKEMYARAIENRYPMIKGVFGWVDGFNVRVQDTRFYKHDAHLKNSWKGKGSFVGNIFVLVPTGQVCFYVLNSPGSWHDSFIAAPVYHMLMDNVATPPPFRICGDSAFRASGSLAPKVLTPLTTRRMSEEAKRYNECVVEFRQAVEWHMRNFRSCFARLNDRLPIDDELRGLILEAMVKLYNLKTATIGGSQIQSVYAGAMPVEKEEVFDGPSYYYRL